MQVSYRSEILNLSTVLLYRRCQNKSKFKINKTTTLIYNVSAQDKKQQAQIHQYILIYSFSDISDSDTTTVKLAIPHWLNET